MRVCLFFFFSPLYFFVVVVLVFVSLFAWVFIDNLSLHISLWFQFIQQLPSSIALTQDLAQYSVCLSAYTIPFLSLQRLVFLTYKLCREAHMFPCPMCSKA